MGIQTTRKCKECKGSIVLEEGNFIETKISEKQFVYYHYECYVTKLVNKKRGAVDEVEARKIADGLKEESRRNTEEIVAKNHLFKWLQFSYDLVVLPNYFYQKMEDIFKGEFKGLSEGISPEDILYIWQRKKQEFDQQNDYQRRQGKNIEGTSRLNYDLAIVLSKYDSFKKWKEKQKIIQQQNRNELQQKRINEKLLDKLVMANTEKEKDLSDYLEEV